jgi:hypothetical protein
MLALVRPAGWNLPLFLHVLGAIVLTGSVAATLIASVRAQESPLLRRVAFRTLLAVVIPAWLLMRFAGQWINSREDVPGDPTWLGLGFAIADAGVVFLLVTTFAGWWSVRKPALLWPTRTVTALTALYLAALLVAMFAMSGKPGA